MKKNGSAKIAIIIISVLVGLVILAVGGYFIFDNMQYNIVKNEVAKINFETAVDMELKSQGKYQNLERGIKEYANEYYENAKVISDFYAKGELNTALGIENIKKDGPNFETTKGKINHFKEEENKAVARLQEMITQDYMNQKMTELALNEKQKELFRSALQLENDVKEIVEISESYNKFVGAIESVINFLIDNQANWSVKDDKVMFKKIDLLEKYNTLIDELNAVQKELLDLANKVNGEQ